MKALLNRKQALILSTLAIITLTLALCMWAAGIFGGRAPVAENDPPVWTAVRGPRPSLNEAVVWETRFGGSGNEKVEAAFSQGNKIVVFGNTDSTDYDFTAAEGARGFIAVLTDAGWTESFHETDPITAVTLDERGYLIGFGGQNPRLALVDFGLALIAESTLFEQPAKDESIVDIVRTDAGCTVVSRIPDHTAGSDALRVVFFDKRLVRQKVNLLNRSANLSYLDTFAIGNKTVIAANFTSDIIGCLTFIELTGGSPLFYDVTAESRYTAADVIPYADGYAAIVLTDEQADILTVDKAYKAAKKIYLNAGKCLSGRLIPDAFGGYYAYLHKGGDVSHLARLDSALTYRDSVPEANVLSGAYGFFIQGGHCNILCGTGDKLLILSLGEPAGRVEIAVKIENALWVRTPKGPVVVTESLEGTDCPEALGGTDVGVIRLAG